MQRICGGGGGKSKIYLIVGILFNLFLLGFFKYTDFFCENFNLFSALLHLDFTLPLPHILLPLALSFVTFQQIAFLVDCYKCIDIADIQGGFNTHIKAKSEDICKNDKSNNRDSKNNTESAKDFNATSAKQIPYHKTYYNINDIKKPHIHFIDYCLFISFFPQLIAGPIVHHKEIMPQFNTLSPYIKWDYVAKGLFIFTIGLFKKVCIADSFAKWANAGFKSVENGEVLNTAESWATSLSYTFQLYFDFSGYCDMAIGLGLLFGIMLPINFNSPYKAYNISDFWRRWHITLGRFLRDYLYIPLGGNKNLKYASSKYYICLNKILTLRNLFIVAFLSGVWHGAGWGFVMWGVLHGLAMIIHRIYMWWIEKIKEGVSKRFHNQKKDTLLNAPYNKKALHTKKRILSTRYKSILLAFLDSKLYAILCWFITFNFINIAWIFFRSENVQGALNLLKGMFGGNLILPTFLESSLHFLDRYSVRFGKWAVSIDDSSVIIFFSVFGAMVVCLKLRNTIELINSFKPTYCTLLQILICSVIALLCIDRAQQFLYFNF